MGVEDLEILPGRDFNRVFKTLQAEPIGSEGEAKRSIDSPFSFSSLYLTLTLSPFLFQFPPSGV